MFLLKHLNYSHWSAIAWPSFQPCCHDDVPITEPRSAQSARPADECGNETNTPGMLGDHAGGCQRWGMPTSMAMAPQSMSFFFFKPRVIYPFYPQVHHQTWGRAQVKFSSRIPAWLNLHSAPNAPIQIIGWWKSPAKTWAGHGCGATRHIKNNG